jgi:hypothetical protein
VKDFTSVLQSVVATIDKYGLKQHFLQKHKTEVNDFLENVIQCELKTEIAIHYQNRFKKSKNKLFEFLNHDNVSWNNSNAEHAIRLLAIHANKNLNAFRASRIDDYLKIFSIFQTCDYKEISFLKFLLTKEENIDNYIKNYR